MEAGGWLAVGGLILAIGGVVAGRGFAIGKMTTLIDGLQKNFYEFRKDVRSDIQRIDGRCESRLADCGAHFGDIDKRVAVLRGKAND